MMILNMMVSRGRLILTIRHREMSVMMINVMTDVGIVMIIMNRVIVDDGTIDNVMSMVVNFVRWSVVSTVWMEVVLGITVVVMGRLFINNLMRCFIDVLVVVSVRV